MAQLKVTISSFDPERTPLDVIRAATEQEGIAEAHGPGGGYSPEAGRSSLSSASSQGRDVAWARWERFGPLWVSWGFDGRRRWVSFCGLKVTL